MIPLLVLVVLAARRKGFSVLWTVLSETLPMTDFSAMEDTGTDLPVRVELPLAILIVETESPSLSGGQ